MEAKTIIFEPHELDLLFPTETQRQIFRKGMQRLVDAISARTVTIPFTVLEHTQT